MQKKLWAGVVGGTIEFFNSDPNGNVENLEGSRSFCIDDNKHIVDEQGASLLTNTESSGGANTQGATQQPPATA